MIVKNVNSKATLLDLCTMEFRIPEAVYIDILVEMCLTLYHLWKPHDIKHAIGCDNVKLFADDTFFFQE